ncbi:protein NOI4-like isoform X1 [Actinidia eriantha]|uniref:protein NOI4-like isoform X1 n=1 Tax=Actinidia eriantha TaxID=165200 RepID=UPI00258EDBAF|nr:protein NOI4-like isoform X1 [Actinidia eriantha]
MATQDRGRPLPKFGEWDVNNPASADGFTVIFAKARDEKKTTGITANAAPPSQRNDMNQPPRQDQNYQHPPPEKKWFCCF